jgi:hypothetical protein
MRVLGGIRSNGLVIDTSKIRIKSLRKLHLVVPYFVVLSSGSFDIFKSNAVLKT